MPFHVSGRKPGHPTKALRFPLGCRLLIAALGAALVLLGGLSRNPLNFGYLNWRGQPVYPNALVPIGAILIILSFVPTSWIERTIERLAR